VPLDSFCVNTQVPGLQVPDSVTPPSLVSGCTPIYIFVPNAQCLFHSAAVARLVPRSDSVVYTRLLFWCLKDSVKNFPEKGRPKTLDGIYLQRQNNVGH
jgi:hypothetical protein